MNTLKRYITHFTLISLVFTSCFAEPKDAIQKLPTAISKINRRLVDLHKARITQQLIRNRYDRMVINCATVAVIAAGGWYAFHTPVVVDKPLTQDNNKNIPLIKENTELTRIFSQEIMQQVSRINKQLGIDSTAPKATPPPTLLQAWGRNIWNTGKMIGHNAVIQMGVLVVSGVLPLPRPIARLFNYWGNQVERIGEHFYHDADFHWFVTSQTQAVSYFNDLERAAELLPLATDEEDRGHQKKSMIWTADALVKQLARVIAFMEYQADKVKTLNVGCSIQMKASAIYMYRHVGLFSSELQAMLDDSSKYAEIPVYIKSFRERLRSEQDSFCVNEHAAREDIFDEVGSPFTKEI